MSWAKTKPSKSSSRHGQKRLTAAILCVSLILLLVYIDHRVAAKRSLLKPKTSGQLENLDWQKYNGKKFEVLNVVDGDTLDIDIPDGQYDRTRIRLWGVDTPETKSKEKGIMYFGTEATEFTKKAALGFDVVIYLDKNSTRGKYQRLLAYVKLPDGKILNEQLVSNGFAYADIRIFR